MRAGASVVLPLAVTMFPLIPLGIGERSNAVTALRTVSSIVRL